MPLQMRARYGSMHTLLLTLLVTFTFNYATVLSIRTPFARAPSNSTAFRYFPTYFYKTNRTVTPRTSFRAYYSRPDQAIVLRAPSSTSYSPTSSSFPKVNQSTVARLAYTLEEDKNEDTSGNKILSLLASYLRSGKLIDAVWSLLGRLNKERSTDDDPRATRVLRRHPSSEVRRPYSKDETLAQRQFDASFSLDEPSRSVNSGASRKSLQEEEWAETLFGPSGVLTAIFHVIDDREKGVASRSSGSATSSASVSSGSSASASSSARIATAAAAAKTAASQADPSPSFIDFFKNAKRVDFARIFDAFVSGAQGDFEDPLAELPEFLGICNRLSCGDIYKAIDEFRKSEFFTNFQTALQLVQDPKGWEILGNLLSNPDLIAQFAGGGTGLEKLVGSALPGQAKGSKTAQSRKPSTEITPGDGDLGVDFSSLVEGSKPAKEKKPTPDELPEIAENIDPPDYYVAIEKGTGEEEIVEGATVMKPDEVIPPPPSPVVVSKNRTEGVTTGRAVGGNVSSRNSTTALVVTSGTLPIIEESIDEPIESATRIDEIAVTNKANYTVTAKPRPLTMWVTTSTTPATSSTTTTRRQTERSTWSTASLHPTQTAARRPLTTNRPTTRRSTKNFRKDSDYYAMYYDDVRE